MYTPTIPPSDDDTRCAEGDETRLLYGHLGRVQPLVNPIRLDRVFSYR
jgi:hypothetical protein